VTIDPIAIIGAITALGSLLLYVVRQTTEGTLVNPEKVVPRVDYDKVVAINEGYASQFGEQTKAVQGLATAVTDLAKVVTPNKPVP
jgi:hypothetical protein